MVEYQGQSDEHSQLTRKQHAHDGGGVVCPLEATDGGDSSLW